jgi:polar amino acid transport system substrate-binding protein
VWYIRVAVVGGTTSSTLDDTGAKFTKAKTAREAVLLLEARRVDAVVFDSPTLQHYAKENANLTTVGGMFELQDYGIVMKKYHTKRDVISMKVLSMLGTAQYRQWQIKWFGVYD